MKTIYQTFSSGDAQLVRSRLEAAGFQVNVADELAALSMDGYSLATGGIRVQVSDEDAEDAQALVNDKEHESTQA